MPDLDIRSAGNGPKRTAVWLDGKPCMITSLDEWPKVGDRFVIDGELWRVIARPRTTPEVLGSRSRGWFSLAAESSEWA